ncbi:flagellin [Klebsiella sp. WP3-W18-ESBL-02]|uniref:FliC/FljB family flagellin n=1 Tax=Klebsiella sp. WP3-W18-ESBL-02 TaxID=2675710 RepID=UPI0015DBFC18|nr:FliC/FljB family flagellin [Klebsiella sp. WP3-W18-ESBL-02]BBQ83305.1 flagellin [Klebsiella sp. WP3-W18-ESBL-02]
MAQVINTNSLSLITQNNINKNQSALSTSIERLSSGLRINSAKDDAAGQAIANRFTSNIKGLTQAARNANDGISLAQTTEGALSEINNNLQRVRELTVQATTGTNSDSDLASIQDEIKSRLDEIDRVSGQTQFNGVNVLAKDGSLKIQVGANDGQTITIDLKKIDSSTLGLNGFNVNGSGTVNNKAATVSNLTAAGATETATGSGLYNLTTKNDAVSASDAFAKLSTGDTVSVKTYVDDGAGDITTNYTYDATSGNFSYAASVDNTDVTTFAQKLIPASGSQSGVYTASNGSTASVKFDVDSNGKVTIGGQDAFLDTAGNLTTSNAGGTGTAATLDGLMQASADAAKAATGAYTSSVSVGGTTYNFTDATNGNMTYTATISKDEVMAKVASTDTASTVAGHATASTVNYASGVLKGSITFNSTGADVGKADATYKDANGNFTDVKQFTTQYKVDKDTGAVTVNANLLGDGTAGTVDNSNSNPFAKSVGSAAYVTSGGKITSEATAAGTATKDPLAALDAAISSIDKFRSSLGAIQNRLDSAVTNLNNTTTNLSEAQSRIQDADYATEVSNMSKAQIIQQAGNSVLAKANQVPQQVLSLLQG